MENEIESCEESISSKEKRMLLPLLLMPCLVVLAKEFGQ